MSSLTFIKSVHTHTQCWQCVTRENWPLYQTTSRSKSLKFPSQSSGLSAAPPQACLARRDLIVMLTHVVHAGTKTNRAHGTTSPVRRSQGNTTHHEKVSLLLYDYVNKGKAYVKTWQVLFTRTNDSFLRLCNLILAHFFLFDTLNKHLLSFCKTCIYTDGQIKQLRGWKVTPNSHLHSGLCIFRKRWSI